MSNEELIPVPANGHRPPLPADPDAAGRDLPEPTVDGGPSVDEVRVAVSPGQVAAGFGIIAALILLVVGRRRGKRG